MKEEFKKWLSNQEFTPGKKYAIKTVEHYISGIETIRKEFNIDFWNISDEKDLLEKQSMIMTNSDFINKNEKGKKMYSCAIDRYIDFIYDKINFNLFAEIKEIEKDYTLSYEEKNQYIETICNLRNPQFQRHFKKELLQEFNCKCALCGINDKRLLIASHIIPYSECKNKTDMYRAYNGLLLCTNHDALFDKKLISFDANGRIYVSCSIREELYKLLNLDKSMMLDGKYITDERRKNLNVHFSSFKKKEYELYERYN